ncbi:MAG: hypothetical protein CL903_01460 [Dehalococcoidia bacterium]|nr:hypothetical protein [Dehalococcoidia bacterium]MQG09526.1 hypothetical protein [SAR202 cluster bacterium]|tara:strand:- start:27711 stop:28232 length:522 start_codon:yes stop_codon:yes gene_type:complete
MNLEELIIAFFRILASTIVFKFNFIGGLFVIFIDFSDLIIMNMINLGGVKNYQSLDKILDLFYMSYFLIISLKWEKTIKKISFSLFFMRMIGLVFFELTGTRMILLIFPNVFEFWFIGITFFKFRKIQISNRNIFWILTISIILKIVQEFILHYWKILDKYTLLEFIEKITNF